MTSCHDPLHGEEEQTASFTIKAHCQVDKSHLYQSCFGHLGSSRMEPLDMRSHGHHLEVLWTQTLGGPFCNADACSPATQPMQSPVYSVFLHTLFGCHRTNVCASLIQFIYVAPASYFCFCAAVSRGGSAAPLWRGHGKCHLNAEPRASLHRKTALASDNHNGIFISSSDASFCLFFVLWLLWCLFVF